VKAVIYVLTNEVNGKVYIGATRNWARRRYEHICAAKSWGSLMYPDIQDLGWAVFSVELIPCAETDLATEEQRYIALYRRIFGKELVYNRSGGGECNRPHRQLESQFETPGTRRSAPLRAR
jgi:group I intron endonuclease